LDFYFYGRILIIRSDSSWLTAKQKYYTVFLSNRLKTMNLTRIFKV
jgi:hypothetical protein